MNLVLRVEYGNNKAVNIDVEKLFYGMLHNDLNVDDMIERMNKSISESWSVLRVLYGGDQVYVKDAENKEQQKSIDFESLLKILMEYIGNPYYDEDIKETILFANELMEYSNNNVEYANNIIFNEDYTVIFDIDQYVMEYFLDNDIYHNFMDEYDFYVEFDYKKYFECMTRFDPNFYYSDLYESYINVFY